MAMAIINECRSPSLKDKLKSSICYFASASYDDRRIPLTPRSTYAWLKSTVQDLEIKDKCWSLIGRRGKNIRRRYTSADFKYDLASYSLNFEDEIKRYDELPLRNFSARLPAVSKQGDDELNAWL